MDLGMKWWMKGMVVVTHLTVVVGDSEILCPDQHLSHFVASCSAELV